jgi:lysophospholipase L1-like esterase
MVMLLLTVGAFEGTLALMKFEVDMAPVVFALENEEGTTETSRGYSDPELRFRFRKGELYHGRMINQLGYREREVDPVKAPNTMRVICLGDSVTAQGKPGYSQYLHDRLQEVPPTDQPWEAFNMAVYGYSSMQGLRVFQLETVHLDPDVVTIFFGWNDHWLEMQTDRNRMAIKTHPLLARAHEKLKDKRIYMLVSSLVRPSGADLSKRTEPGFRVPPEEYVSVLHQLVREIRAIDARPLLITAPRREVHPTEHRFPEVSATLDYGEIHDDYVELTRQVAIDSGADILDLHQILADPTYDKYFLNDGIHFRQEGLPIIADLLHKKLLAMYTEP